MTFAFFFFFGSWLHSVGVKHGSCFALEGRYQRKDQVFSIRIGSLQGWTEALL